MAPYAGYARAVLGGSFTRTRGGLAREHMLRWMEGWIPQVQQGSVWMRKAAGNLGEPYANCATIYSCNTA